MNFQAEEALSAITKCCDSGEGNLLGLSIEAARCRCTVGEITDAMEKVWYKKPWNSYGIKNRRKVME